MDPASVFEVGQVWRVRNRALGVSHRIIAVNRARRTVDTFSIVNGRENSKPNTGITMGVMLQVYELVTLASTPTMAPNGPAVCSVCGDRNEYAVPGPGFTCGSCRHDRAMTASFHADV